MTEIEREFLRAIDCRFPYDDERRWKALIDQSVEISPNAAFAVLYEISAPGQSIKSSLKHGQLQNILDYWLSRFSHPVRDVVVPAAIALLNSQTQTEQATIEAMQKVAAFPGLDFALIVLDYACDDVDGRVDAASNAIGETWRASQLKP